MNGPFMEQAVLLRNGRGKFLLGCGLPTAIRFRPNDSTTPAIDADSTRSAVLETCGRLRGVVVRPRHNSHVLGQASFFVFRDFRSSVYIAWHEKRGLIPQVLIYLIKRRQRSLFPKKFAFF